MAMEDLMKQDSADKKTLDATPLTDLHAESIDGVIASLDRIIEWSKQHNRRTGYFAALYRKVTRKVKQGIEANHFDDGARMERLDVIFANRYLDAFEAYHNGLPVTTAWQQAFELGDRWSPIVLQHLMIGMNAHINLDLGIAAAQAVTEEQLPDLKPDFDRINGLLASLVNEVEDELGTIWPMLKWIDRLAGNADEWLADRGMTFARDRAWALAEKYAAADDKQAVIERLDKTIFALGLLITSPPLKLRVGLLLVRVTERGDIVKKIAILE